MNEAKEKNMIINVIDIEATCWKEETPANISEIIELGISVLNIRTGEIRRVERQLIKPLGSEVSDFCTELTGITPAQVENKPSFAECWQKLMEEEEIHRRPWMSWGQYDFNMISQQCRQSNLPYSQHHLNIKATYAQLRQCKPAGMTKALRKEKMTLAGRHHQGDDDAYNIACIAAKIASEEQGKKLLGQWFTEA